MSKKGLLAREGPPVGFLLSMWCESVEAPPVVRSAVIIRSPAPSGFNVFSVVRGVALQLLLLVSHAPRLFTFEWMHLAQLGRTKWSSQTELPQSRQWCRLRSGGKNGLPHPACSQNMTLCRSGAGWLVQMVQQGRTKWRSQTDLPHCLQ